MKQFIYPITAIFLFQTTLGTVAFAEPQAVAKTAAAKPAVPAKEGPVVAAVPEADQAGEDALKEGIAPGISKARFAEIMKLRETKPYSSLFVPESACTGKEQLLDGFINEVATTDGNGNETTNKYKGKLTEKELELGDRNFDFDKLQDARFNSQNDVVTNLCLDKFAGQALDEWFNYFDTKSKEFECGLVLSLKDEKTGEYEVKEVPGERKNTCDIPYGNGKLYDFYKAQMEKLRDVINSFNKKSADVDKKSQEAAAEKAKTQATVCTDPAGCPGAGAKDIKDAAKGFEKYSKEWCCQRLGERFEVLGFTTMKDVKPNERVCNELIDKDTDGGYCDGSFCMKTIGDCLKNFASVFLRDFFSSLVSSFDVLGWGSQLMTMVKEIISNPYEAGKNIVKNMFGFDGDYMGCLNKKSQSQYVCQMIGKFAGSSAGFSAGLGGILGLAKGVIGGVAAKMSKTPGAKIIKPALKEAARSGARAAAVGTVWPYYAARGVLKGAWGTVKGTWKHTPILVSRAARTTVSAIPEASGRLLQGTSKVFFKGEGAAAVKGREALGEAAAARLERAKEIRANGRPSKAAEATAAKFDEQIGSVKASVKSLDDEIAALEKRKVELMEDGRISLGKPVIKGKKASDEFVKADLKIKELQKTKAEGESALEQIQKAKEAELKALSDKDAATWNRTRINAKGVVLGTGAAASQYPNNNKPEEKKDGKPVAPKSGDPKVAAPVQGVGTGDGLAAPPAGTPAAAPKAEEKKPAGDAAKPPVAPPAASGKSEKGEEGPTEPPGF